MNAQEIFRRIASAQRDRGGQAGRTGSTGDNRGVRHERVTSAGDAAVSAAGTSAAGRGIPSICTANTEVIIAAMKLAAEIQAPFLVEATSNQVNQFGGYTGMKPDDFRRLIHELAGRIGLPSDAVILGGDHLGPNPWKEEEPEKAMENAVELIRSFAEAGFRKIHLDASMPLGHERSGGALNDDLIAERQAELCVAAERVTNGLSAGEKPVYVIGSEVPVPGGAEGSDELTVTSVTDFETTVRTTKAAFEKRGLTDAWNRVIAVVVQPGMEFGDFYIDHYKPERASELSEALRKHADIVLEGHSTDYQAPEAFAHLVDDGVAILKVGPALTFAYREALFLLQEVERKVAARGDTSGVSRLGERLDNAMLRNPGSWEKYYQGSENEKWFARMYSYSDRCRYYWTDPDVADAVEKLYDNLGRTGIPDVLLSQYFMEDYMELRGRRVYPQDLSARRIRRVLLPYYRACGYQYPASSG